MRHEKTCDRHVLGGELLRPELVIRSIRNVENATIEYV